MKIKPLGDRVLIKLEEVEEQTAGGIFIPQTAQEKTQTGIVEAVGEDETIQVKQGQKVMYDKYAGTQVTDNEGNEYLLVSYPDMLAVME